MLFKSIGLNVAFMLILLEGSGICQAELSKFAISVLQRGGLMDEFWSRVIYEYPEAEHVCDDFGIVLAHDGENDFMICRKCGKGWIAPSHVKGKTKGQKHRKLFSAR
jgi:hypothetical protein